VAETSGDDVGVFSGRDESGDVGVAKFMWSHWFSDRVVYGRVLGASPEEGEPQPAALGRGEDEVVLTRVGCQVGSELVGEE
jgi:hypothetical protein